jgi:hypothetical protein
VKPYRDDPRRDSVGPNNTASSGGTNGVRINATGSLIPAIGGSAQIAVLRDSHGNWDLQVQAGHTITAPGASITLGFTHTNANSVSDLLGFQAQYGVTGGAVFGGEANVLLSSSYRGKRPAGDLLFMSHATG